MKCTTLCLIVGIFAMATHTTSVHKRNCSSSETYYISYCFSTEQYSYTGTEIDYYRNGVTADSAPDDRAPVPSALFELGADDPGAFLNATFPDSGITVAVKIPLISLYTYIVGIGSNFSATGSSVGSLTRYPDLSSWDCVADNFSTLYYTSSTACQSFAHCMLSNSTNTSSPTSYSGGYR